MGEEWQRALRGELAPVPPSGADAESAAMRAARWAAGLDDGALPEPGALARFRAEGPEARSAALCAAWVAGRVALVRRDAGSLIGLVQEADALVSDGCDAEGAVARGLIHASLDLARGVHDGAMGSALSLERAALAAGAADQVVEAASIAALARLAAGDLEGARALARRASRMARTESLPQPEYLAHTTLARVRRTEGRAYLATRILLALARVAPRPWGEWIALELVLAGEPDAARAIAGAPSTALHLLHAVDCAAALDAAGLRAALARAEESAASWAPIALELAEARAAIDPEVPAGPAVAAWRAGRAPLPARLLGLSFVAPSGLATAVGAPLVLARPGVPAARLLPLGACLAPHAIPPPADAAKQLRTERAAAELALAGDAGLAREDLFSRIYGFGFRPATHQGVLDVLMHRVRERVAGVGTIDRDDERVCMRIEQAALFLDEPAESPIADLALRALARRPGASARDVAEDLGIALRTVQTALRGLVEEGACGAEKQGRIVAYRVEDTTFREPSHVMLVP